MKKAIAILLALAVALSLAACGSGAPKQVKKVRITGAKRSVVMSESVALSAVVSPDDAADKTVTWSSSDGSVLKVDGDGVVTGLSGGTATVTATASSGVSASKEIKVDGTARKMDLRVETRCDVDIGDGWTESVKVNRSAPEETYVAAVDYTFEFKLKYTKPDEVPDDFTAMGGSAYALYIVRQEDVDNGFTVTIDMPFKVRNGLYSTYYYDFIFTPVEVGP